MMQHGVDAYYARHAETQLIATDENKYMAAFKLGKMVARHIDKEAGMRMPNSPKRVKHGQDKEKSN